MYPQLQELIGVLSQFHPVPQAAQQFLEEHCAAKVVKKGEYLLRPGEICNAYYFIRQGVVRAFIKQEEKEVTTWISCPNELATSIYSMQERTPSVEYIQVIRDSVLIELNTSSLEELFLLVPEVNFLIRKLLTAYYRDAEIRSFIARIPSAEARCRYYLETFPEKASLVPQKYIASFLGIREETLSRIFKKC